MKKDRNKSHYIINNKINLLYQLRDLALTLLLWGLWLYIFYPLIGLIVWKFFDIDIFFYYDSTTQIQALDNSLKKFLLFSAGIILLLISALIGWGRYNKKKFTGYKDKRRKVPLPISSKMMADALKINSQAIDACKASQYIQIYHTDKAPDTKEELFKSTADINVQNVKLIFSDNWDEIRKTSDFGYTHRNQEKENKLFYLTSTGS